MSETAKVGELIPVEIEFEHPFARVLNSHLAVVIDGFHYGGKIVIPDNAKRKPTKGRVVALADNITDIQIGDRVLYSQFAGYLLIFEGLPAIRMIGYEEVLGILKKNTPDLISEGS
jgi:chaperonin GroES